MKQYFYTDPLAAAWMMKHFKMRIHTGGGDICDFRADFSLDRYEEDLLSAGGKLYLHPGSLPLLEPQAGDMITGYDGKMGPRIVTEIPADDKTHQEVLCSPLGYVKEHITCLRILQRNGIAFMWPDSEEA